MGSKCARFHREIRSLSAGCQFGSDRSRTHWPFRHFHREIAIDCSANALSYSHYGFLCSIVSDHKTPDSSLIDTITLPKDKASAVQEDDQTHYWTIHLPAYHPLNAHIHWRAQPFSTFVRKTNGSS